MTTEKQIIERLMAKVIEMRQAQKDYFARKMQADLKKSKSLESELDEYLVHLTRKGYKAENGRDAKVEQNGLF